MQVKRKPKGYVGLNHTTRGGDILAVLETIHRPEHTLGPDLARRLKLVSEDQWYPIGDFLEMLEVLEQKLGSYHLRQVGWTIFGKFHAPEVRQRFDNARDLLSAFDVMYHQGNKGLQIGGWELRSFTGTNAELEKTTPHHCVMEEGILQEALRTVGVTAKVEQSQCFRKGAESCVYVITPRIADERWSGRAGS